MIQDCIDSDDSSEHISPLFETPRSPYSPLSPLSPLSSTMKSFFLSRTGLSGAYNGVINPTTEKYVNEAYKYPVRLAEKIRTSASLHITDASSNLISMARSGTQLGIDTALGIIPDSFQGGVKSCVGLARVNATNVVNQSIRQAVSRRDKAVETVHTGTNFVKSNIQACLGKQIDTAEQQNAGYNLGNGKATDSRGEPPVSGTIDTLLGYTPTLFRLPVKRLAMLMFGA
jgi:hypothetical protein